MPTTESAKLYGHWLALWNGDLATAETIIAANCVIHHPRLANNDPRSAIERISAMVRESRALFQKLIFTLDVGPIEEDDKLAARWTGRGSYAGGLSEASAPAGTAVSFSGIDLFRVREGKIAEYWSSSDALHLMEQLGAFPQPATR